MTIAQHNGMEIPVSTGLYATNDDGIRSARDLRDALIETALTCQGAGFGVICKMSGRLMITPSRDGGMRIRQVFWLSRIDQGPGVICLDMVLRDFDDLRTITHVWRRCCVLNRRSVLLMHIVRRIDEMRMLAIAGMAPRDRENMQLVKVHSDVSVMRRQMAIHNLPEITATTSLRNLKRWCHALGVEP